MLSFCFKKYEANKKQTNSKSLFACGLLQRRTKQPASEGESKKENESEKEGEKEKEIEIEIENKCYP